MIEHVGGDPSQLFRTADGRTYLDTATYGLAPLSTTAAMRQALDAWEIGTARWIEDWDVAAEDARHHFAGIAGVGPANVSLLPSASVGVGTVAASLGPGARIVVAEHEFTSLLFPLLVAQQRGAVVSEAPIDGLAAVLDPETDLVAFSLVDMQSGRVAPVADIVRRAREVGARVLIDATHGIPFVDPMAADADFVVCAAYKHLLCPRGTAFLTVRDDRLDELVPWNANWRAADDPYGRYVGGPLTLAHAAARFDTSMAWHLWIGASASLGLIRQWRREGALDAVLDRTADLATRLGLPPTGSSIVSVPVTDMERAREALDRGLVKAGVHTAAVRLSCHVYTTPDDIDRAVRVLAPLAVTTNRRPPTIDES
jgi:selenocysteine lyase/cysteine desulfurase